MVREAVALALSVTSVGQTSAVVTGAPAWVQYGAGAQAPLWSERGRAGSVRLRGLLPGTPYAVRARGAAVRFRTLPAPVVRTSVGARGAILLNGSPFLPVLQWLQCPALFPQSVALGVNVFLGRGCDNETNAGEVDALRAAGAYSVLPFDRAVASAPALFGWRFEDEPDQKGIRPAELARQYRANRAADPRRLNFLTVTTGFYSRMRSGSLGDYVGYARATDAIGFDLYPVTGWCRPDWVPRVYEAQRELAALAAGRPTYQWIEAIATASKFCAGRGVSAPELRAEVWLALAGGAKAVGYFTHSWKPTYSQFRVAADVQAEMRRTDAQVAALAPALLAAPLPVHVDGAGVVAFARRFHGATYVVAVNSSRERVAARVAAGGKSYAWTLPPLGVRIASTSPRG
jgi:hypothetical protein